MVPKGKNVFYNDRGFPDQSHDFDVLLHNTAGSVLGGRHVDGRKWNEVIE
jgi:hypothetical protein